MTLFNGLSRNRSRTPQTTLGEEGPAVFDIGFLEFLVTGLVAVVAFGPDRLPEFVRTAARLLNQVRGMAARAQHDLREELGPEFADLDLRELDPRTLVRTFGRSGCDPTSCVTSSDCAG